MCFGCSKEPSQRDGSFENPQHMFWMGIKENNFPIRTLIWRPADLKCMGRFLVGIGELNVALALALLCVCKQRRLWKG